MLGMELVSNRVSKAPASKAVVGTVFDTAYAEGLMIRISGNTVILSPPLIITPADVTRIVAALDAALAAASV